MVRVYFVSVAQGIERLPPEQKAARSIRAGHIAKTPVIMAIAGVFVLPSVH